MKKENYQLLYLYQIHLPLGETPLLPTCLVSFRLSLVHQVLTLLVPKRPRACIKRAGVANQGS